MNKKGFTLVELILVIVIIGIITVVTVPRIVEYLNDSKEKSSKAIEKLLTTNLELYNNDNMNGEYKYFVRKLSDGTDIKIYDRQSELWNIKKQYAIGSYCKHVSFTDLSNVSGDIKLRNCLLVNPDEGLTIERIVSASPDNPREYRVSYKYYANIVCGENLLTDNGYSISGGYSEGDAYYVSTAKPNC